MRTDQNITWRVFATWRLSIAVLVFEVASLITSDQLASLGVTPYLTLPVLTAAFFVRRVDHWIFTALWSAVGLLAAQAMMYLLAVGSQHTILDTTRSLSTDLSLIGFQVTSGLVLVAGIALLGKYAASVSYDEAGVLCSIELESIFGWRSSTFFAALSIYAYLMRSLEVVVSASLLDTTIKAWTLMQSDILAVFILLPAIIGAVLSLAGAPRLEPDLKPFWVIIICYIAFVGLATWLGLSFGSLFSVVSISVAYGVLAILSTLAPTVQWSGRLLLINLTGFITVSLHNGISVTELFAVTSSMSFLVLMVMTLRLIAQINMNRVNARTELYLRAGTGAFAIMSEEHEFLYVSEQFLKMTEYESLEALPDIRQMIVDLSSEEHAKLHARVRAVQTGVLRLPTRSNTLKTKSGREIKVERSIRWFEIPGEEKRRLSVSYADVTDKARLEVERADQEEVLNAFVYDGPQCCFVEDEEFKIRLISEGAAELIAGKSSAELIGKDPLEYFCIDDQKRIMAARSQRDERLERGETVVSDTPLTFKRGEAIVKVLIQVKLLRLQSGAVMRGIIFDDITKVEQARQQAEDYLQAGTGSFLIQNECFETLYVSEKVFDLVSQEDANLINGGDASSLLKFWPDFDHSYWVKHRQEINALKTGEIWESPKPERVLTSSAEERYIIRTRRWFSSDNSGARLLYTALQDVTALYVEQEFTNSLLSSSSALIVTQTKDGVIQSVSQAFVDLMGYEREDLVGRDLIELYHPEDQAAGSAGRKNFQEVRQQEITIERRLIDANNQTKTFILNARASNVSAVYESILTLSDITALKAAEEKLRHLVERDELTGIYSRRGMKHRFGSDQRSEDFGLYLIDLDHFKLVNDAYGHDAGDMLLKATANVLESQTRSEGSCFRLGGEEFALLRPWRGWKDAYDFSKNLRELIGATSIESDGRSVQRTASIGVSYLSQNGSMSEALELADIVLREAKELGRNCCVLADEDTLAAFEERGVFIQASEVQLALERGEMEYFVQPIVGGAENSTIGFEALIRWLLPSGELVGPMKFVDVLYHVIRQPYYAQLQLDLRRQVLERLKDYPEQFVSFNFTLEQIGYLGGAKALHRDIQSILDHPNRQIMVELSEKALHSRLNEDVLIEELSQLRAFGYKIALDDFGVESSNIQRLQNYPIDIVKIDRSLISEVATSESTRKMVGSLAALLKSLELSVTVEGIETQEQAKIINDFGLTTHQGNYYSEPIPPVELLSRVAE